MRRFGGGGNDDRRGLFLGSFQDSQHCPPWLWRKPRAVIAYGAVRKLRGTLWQHIG